MQLKYFGKIKIRTIDWLLLLFSFTIYYSHFHFIFLNINSVLSSITLDSLKNYYTFVYHIKNDSSALNFTGMNYPYGEHIVYTDCQPILTFILRLFPFTHGYLIGILHSVMFLSFILSPLILIRIFRELAIDNFSGFFLSLGIALLAPQFLKINAGHFALAYGCVFPIIILFLLRYLKRKQKVDWVSLSLFNTVLFFLHPYLGICSVLFCFLALLGNFVLEFEKKNNLKQVLILFLSTLAPVIFFQLFMYITDSHTNRTTEPFGAALMVENIDSLLAPVFGPFQTFMEGIFPNRTTHYEGHTYLGFSIILLTLLVIVLITILRRKIIVNKPLLILFISSFLILLISFGLHSKLLDLLNIKSATVNQFRAVCRFSWLFYYTFPIFLISLLYPSLKNVLSHVKFTRIMYLLSFLLFSSNLFESHFLFNLDSSSYWKFRNFFSERFLNEKEKINLNEITKKQPQAIIPLPIFHGGSEMYDRLGSNNSMIPSMIYSYHSGVPILSVMLSRTSLTETENLIQTFNSYKKEKAIVHNFDSQCFFGIITNDAKLPDETRLMHALNLNESNDSLRFTFISREALLRPKKGAFTLNLNTLSPHQLDSTDVFFVHSDNRKPFLQSNMQDYETVLTLDSNRIHTGKYIVSLHFFYKKKTYQALACGLIVTESSPEGSAWKYTIPIRYLSGFYSGYGVFEYEIELNQQFKYEFILKGIENEAYSISNFLLRPEAIDTKFSLNTTDTLYNNYAY